MKHLYTILLLVTTLATNNSYAQGCDPLINGFSFSIANCLDGNTAELTVGWGMGGSNPLCTAPANSFAIQISLPASEIYGVFSVADVTTTSSFNWTLINPYTLEGVNNVDIDWLDQGNIVVEISPKLTNGCILLESNSNIVIFGSGPPYFGSPNSYTDDATNNSSSDDLGVADISLPVSLLSFNTQNIDCNQNEISWTTGSEINNKGFTIQRSIDGKTFDDIAFMESNPKATLGVREYRLLDKQLDGSDKFYYRLKQISLNNQYKIFNTKSVEVNCESNLDISLYPNPAKEELYFNITSPTDTDLELLIYALDGKLVSRQTSTLYNGVIDISHLKAGLHVLKINTNRDSISKNFIKIN